MTAKTATLRAGRTACFFIFFLILLILFALPPQADALEEEPQPLFDGSNTVVYTLTHTVTLTNHGSRLAYDITVDVPLQDEYLPQYNTRLGQQLDPYPKEIYTDEQGRRFARYYIPGIRSNSSVTLTQKYVIGTDSGVYHIDTLSEQQLSPQENILFSAYLKAEPGVESTASSILSFARTAVNNTSNSYQKARSLFSRVNLALTYSDAKADQSARAVLERGSGNCEGYANLYTACLRAAGIPARKVSGYLYLPFSTDQNTTVNANGLPINDKRHVWVEFYLPDQGWVPADPTFTYYFEFGDSRQKFIDWSYFANISSGRRYLTLNYGGEAPDIRYTATNGDLSVDFLASLAPGSNYLPFNDLRGHWAAADATYCVEQGYFNGYSPQEFKADMPMTRGMFVAVLGRLFQAHGGKLIPYQADLSIFSDVDAEKYYSEALGWALDEKLVEGYGSGLFGVDDPVTREQMAKMIAAYLRLLKQSGVEIELLEAQKHQFTDSELISGWAAESIAFCVSNRILSGYNTGAFGPGDPVTRGQVAAILRRIDDRIAVE